MSYGIFLDVLTLYFEIKEDDKFWLGLSSFEFGFMLLFEDFWGDPLYIVLILFNKDFYIY